MNNLETIQLRKVADSSDHEAWMDARMSGVTASDVANFEEGIDLSKLVYKKLNNTFKGNVWTEWGIEREPYLLQWAGYEQNTTLFRASQNPRFMATPDGYKIVDGKLRLCQVKTTSKGWDEIPPNYLRQVQWEMLIMDAQENLLVWEQHRQFVPIGLEPESMLIERDDKEIERLVQLANQFLLELDKQKEGII